MVDAFRNPKLVELLIGAIQGNDKTNFVLRLIAELVKYERLNSAGRHFQLATRFIKSGISEFESNLLIERGSISLSSTTKSNSPEI